MVRNWVSYGETECESCGESFTTTFTNDSEEIEGWTRSEDHPDELICDFCKGDESCGEKECNNQATAYDTEGKQPYCAPCWSELAEGMDEEETEEHEKSVTRLPDELHDKKEGK